MTEPVLYLNYLQTKSGKVGAQTPSRDYLAACRFLHCGIIDRTSTLDQGFRYGILDPISDLARSTESFAEICDARAEELLTIASKSGKQLVINWSGGIDSTSALIALMKATSKRSRQDLLVVSLSMESVMEYPEFFRRHINGQHQLRPVNHPISAFLDPGEINVTGEHGDQLFGSHLLESYVRRGLAGVDYRDILPIILAGRFRNPVTARRVQRYLQPVVDAAPVPIVTLFDYLWWMNFALKWQDVSLRLAVFRGFETRAIFQSIEHFFRDERFQGWALSQGENRMPPTWSCYKEEAKHYILDFTSDHDYYLHKRKVVSLKHVMVDPANSTAFQVWMNESFLPEVTAIPTDKRTRSSRWNRRYPLFAGDSV